MNCCASQNSICPCGAFIHPARISNVAGLDAISYRAGDYTAFREALLRALPGEVSLTCPAPAGSSVNGPIVQIWRPGATGDLAVQMMEWWAYLADILTFYNERTATQAYLRTADQLITVNRLVRLLGYRPKPGIGATGTLAALMNGTATFTLPQGFQIQSKPGPGQQPQIFEVKAATAIQIPDVAAIGPTGMGTLLSPDGMSVLFSGVVKSIKANDQLLLLEQPWSGADASYAPVTVQGTAPEKDPWGNTNTRVTFTGQVTGLPSNALAAGYGLLKSTQSAPLWSYPTTVSLLTSNSADLVSVYRQIKVGDPILVTCQTVRIIGFETTYTSGTEIIETEVLEYSAFSHLLASVNSYSEVVWYANAPSASDPTIPPNPATIPPVPLLHTQLGLSFPQQAPLPAGNIYAPSVQVAFAFQEAGTLIGTPSPTLSGLLLPLIPPPSANPLGNGHDVMIEDANGNGVEVDPSGYVTTGNVTIVELPNPIDSANLVAPARFLYNLFPVTRGKTVANEVLGTGNAAVAGQDFTLQNTPVTYLADGAGLSDDGYSSTVQVWVNDIEWSEVRSFYGQSGSANVFITKEDEQGRTHVIFGDGQNGACPPTGASIVADYRYGSGAAAPAAGSLSVILKPLPGLKAIRNPVQVGGGGDPDPKDQVREYAPRSVLSFGRAVSVDDFVAIASAAAGVTCAQVDLGFSGISQRPQVRVYVIPGTTGAVQSAQNKLAAAADPNRIPAVVGASMIRVRISATLLLEADADPATVQTNATSAVAGQNSGLFVFDPNSGSPGVYILDVGQPVFNSQIYSALKVAGVQAVENFSFRYLNTLTGLWQICGRQRHDPQPGSYFALALINLPITTSPPVPSS